MEILDGRHNSAAGLRTEAPPGLGRRNAKKQLLRRAAPDRSQVIRRAVQLLFFALNLWIGVRFFQFVRYFETGGRTVWAERPPGVEGWLPVASLMDLRLWLATGQAPRIHPAGVFLLLAFCAISLLLRKSFCSWLCPAGTFSEFLWKIGRDTFHRNWLVPRWLDGFLRALKYLLLGLFVYAVAGMSIDALEAFLDGPYGVISDVKMLNFFRTLGLTGAIVLGLLVFLSIFIQNFWCRYLCPYGALLGLLARFSPLRIRRDQDTCIDCAKCARACPSRLAVDRLVTIGSVGCTACLECVAVCPAEGALYLALPRRRRLPAWALAAGIAVLFFGLTGYAKLSGHWDTNVPFDVYQRLVPRANEFAHP